MSTEDEDFLRHFAMPKQVKITSRSSSITNSFVNGLIPVITPTNEEVREALSVLGMINGASCVYCGSPHTEWDHLRPLVVAKRPTGYISEIQNLVPACGKCNQSKGNRSWREWMMSTARLSPSTRGIKDIESRMDRLARFEEWGHPTHVDFVSIVGAEIWDTHWANHERLIDMMRAAEMTAAQIRGQIAEAAGNYRDTNSG